MKIKLNRQNRIPLVSGQLHSIHRRRIQRDRCQLPIRASSIYKRQCCCLRIWNEENITCIGVHIVGPQNRALINGPSVIPFKYSIIAANIARGNIKFGDPSRADMVRNTAHMYLYVHDHDYSIPWEGCVCGL